MRASCTPSSLHTPSHDVSGTHRQQTLLLASCCCVMLYYQTYATLRHFCSFEDVERLCSSFAKLGSGRWVRVKCTRQLPQALAGSE